MRDLSRCLRWGQAVAILRISASQLSVFFPAFCAGAGRFPASKTGCKTGCILGFNILTLKYAGNAGVAAISVILYVNFLFSSIFIGLSTGIAPILSYHFGAKNTESLIELKKYSKKTLLILSPLMCIILLIFNPFLVSLFLKKTDIAYNLSTVGLSIFSFGFLFSGLNIYGSAYFTALSNGKISALISFGKTFIVFFIMSLILPKALGITGVWLIMPITEILTSFVVIKFIRTKSPDFIINRGIRV